MIHGIDVSHHQGKIDWAKVKSDGVSFAIMKAMYEAASHRKDECFEANYAGAVENEILPGVYVYHASASLKDPVKEATDLVAHLGGRPLPYGIWLDLEDKSLRSAGRTAINALIAAETAVYRAASYSVGIYCNKDWYDNVLDPALRDQFKFWVARYPKNDDGTMKNNLSPKSYAVAWQYSSKGKVAGVNTNVDLDVDYVNIPEMFGFKAEQPAPEPVEQPAPEPVEEPRTDAPKSRFQPGRRVVTAANGLNIRAKTTTESDRLGVLKSGASILIDRVDGEWGHIDGWVNLTFTGDK